MDKIACFGFPDHSTFPSSNRIIFVARNIAKLISWVIVIAVFLESFMILLIKEMKFAIEENNNSKVINLLNRAVPELKTY